MRGRRKWRGISKELVQETLEKIEQRNPSLNAVVHLQAERALEEAEERSFEGLPFGGVPLLLKDPGQNQAGEPSSAEVSSEGEFL